MSFTPEQIEQSRRNIAEYEAEILRIRALRGKDPQLKVNNTRAEDLEEKIVAEELFLRASKDEG